MTALPAMRLLEPSASRILCQFDGLQRGSGPHLEAREAVLCSRPSVASAISQMLGTGSVSASASYRFNVTTVSRQEKMSRSR